MMNAITITLPLPHKFLSPNSRACWQAKARIVRDFRLAAKYAAIGAGAPRYKFIEAQATFFFSCKRNRDKDNALASLKSAFDGLADAGIVANDSGITHLPVIFETDKENPRVEIEIAKGAK